ncbi:MAG: SGNH/GDSL hydrolase family protein [Pseudomonadota bacterium]
MSKGSAHKLVAVALGSLLAAAVAAELSLGAWFSRDPLDQLAVPRDTRVTVTVPGDGDVVVRRDHWGFRGPHADPARVAVVTVGGSSTSQPGLPDAATWQGAMARALAEQGRDAPIANAGLDGQSTAGHIRVLEAWLPAVPGLRPRFIIVSAGLDEEMAGRTAVDRLDDADGMDRLRRHSVFLRLVAAQRRAFPAAASADPADPGAYKERLARIAELAHGLGAVPVFVTQPRAPYNAATLAVCQEKGLLCLDLAREVKFEEGDFIAGVHASARGAEKVGRWLAGKLAGLV